MTDEERTGRPPTDEELRLLADTERAREDAQSRSQERWLRHQATESTSMWGVLRVAAEQEAEVVLRTVSGQAHLGTVQSLGADFCGLVGTHGLGVYIPLRAIASVALGTRTALPAVEDERDDPSAIRLIELLGEEAAERPRVGVVTVGAHERIVGDLEVVGRDVLGVRTEGARRSIAYIPLDAVTEVALLGA